MWTVVYSTGKPGRRWATQEVGSRDAAIQEYETLTRRGCMVNVYSPDGRNIDLEVR